MEPEGSLPLSQEPTACSCPVPHKPVHAFPTDLRSNLILFFHLRPSFPSGLFRLPHQNSAHLSFSPYVLRALPISLLDLIALILFWEEYRSWSSSLCSHLHSSVTSSLLGPNIIHSTLFSKTLSLCSSLNVRDEVSLSYKTKGKIIFLCILILMFL